MRTLMRGAHCFAKTEYEPIYSIFGSSELNEILVHMGHTGESDQVIDILLAGTLC